MAEFKPLTILDLTAKKRHPVNTVQVVSARCDARTGHIVVQLTNGASASFPVDQIKGLEEATTGDLKKIELQGRGYGLHFPTLDADVSVSQLFVDFLGSIAMQQSERRLIASKANGRKGGRPKSTVGATA